MSRADVTAGAGRRAARRLALRAAALLALAGLAGCFTIRYERRGAPEAGAPREQQHHGLVGGVFDASGPVKLAEACPDGFASVESQTTFFNWLAQALTSFGALNAIKAPVWEPSTIRVVCARPEAARRGLTVVLLPLATLGDVKKDTAALYGEALAGELRRRAGVSVLADSDIAAILGVEKRRQMTTGCTDAGCLAELGGALGADRVIHGSVGKVGQSLVVNLTSLDAKRGRTVASVSERLRGDDEAFLDALPAMVDKLLAEKDTGPRPTGKPPMPPAPAPDAVPAPPGKPPAPPAKAAPPGTAGAPPK